MLSSYLKKNGLEGPQAWMQLFDVCIFQARKPHFFVIHTHTYMSLPPYKVRALDLLSLVPVSVNMYASPHTQIRNGHFRRLDMKTGVLSYTPVDAVCRGEAYTEGSLKEFSRLMGITGPNVLYMGMYVYIHALVITTTVCMHYALSTCMQFCVRV